MTTVLICSMQLIFLGWVLLVFGKRSESKSLEAADGGFQYLCIELQDGYRIYYAFPTVQSFAVNHEGTAVSVCYKGKATATVHNFTARHANTPSPAISRTISPALASHSANA